MATNRNLVFSNGYVYHVFNRGLDRRTVFTGIREFLRAKELIQFYRHKNTPMSYSKYLQQPSELRSKILKRIDNEDLQVNILAYCLMPNHFHFMLQQSVEKGIPIFVSNFTNAFTKYFNKKNKRSGPLFEGVFKAVLVESDEQLIHLSRYIHLNPVVSSVIKEQDLSHYKWSSYREYISTQNEEHFVEKELVLSMFKSKLEYQKFVLDDVGYAKKLNIIKHLLIE